MPLRLLSDLSHITLIILGPVKVLPPDRRGAVSLWIREVINLGSMGFCVENRLSGSQFNDTVLADLEMESP